MNPASPERLIVFWIGGATPGFLRSAENAEQRVRPLSVSYGSQLRDNKVMLTKQARVRAYRSRHHAVFAPLCINKVCFPLLEADTAVTTTTTRINVDLFRRNAREYFVYLKRIASLASLGLILGIGRILHRNHRADKNYLIRTFQ